MKNLKILLLNVFLISFAISAFGMKKIDSSRDEAFKYLKIACEINFSDSDKKMVNQFFDSCKSGNTSDIDTILDKKDNANKIVCATLFLAVYDSSENLAKEFLAQKKFKKFIFKALSSQEINDAYQILYKMIEVCTNVGLFLFLEDFINQILLESFEKDKDKSWSVEIIDFIVDCGSFFKEVLKKVSDNQKYKTLKTSIDRLFEIVDQDDSQSDSLYDFNRSGDVSGLSGSDNDDGYFDVGASAGCSSDRDSDGECAHTRGWNDHIEYVSEYMDQFNTN